MKKAKLWATLKTISRTGFIIFLCLAIFNLGVLYGTYSEEEESVLTFLTKETKYEWNSIEEPPKILTDQINIYNRIHKLIWASLLFSFAVLFFDYFVDPENHFVTKLKKKLGPTFNKIKDNLEED